MSYIETLRHRRFQWFRDHLPAHPAHTLTILDIGGTAAYWEAEPWAQLAPVAITLLNCEPQSVSAPFIAVTGDACDLSHFPDGAFDVVWCHSVIGHVGGWEAQQQLARDIQRIGRTYCVQTPNFWCPLDWRTLMPCVHWLPAVVQACLFRLLPIGRYPRARTWADATHLATRIRNLTRREMRQLFPDATLHAERVCGFAKSYALVGHRLISGSLTRSVSSRSASPRCSGFATTSRN